MSRLKNLSEDITKTPPCAIGPEKSTLSSMLQDPVRFIRQALNENLVPEDYYIPAHRQLYGFLLKLHENGDEIELVSLIQRLLDNGVLEQVGGPSAVTDIYSYSPSPGHFTLHLSQVKDKAVLREIIRKANSHIKAAYEQPDEVKQLVVQLAQDAAEVAVKTENRASDFKRYKEQVVTSESMKEEARAYLNGDTVLGGDPFFLDGFEFACRKHETTVVCGTSFHGKSQFVQNQIAYLAATGRKSMLASFEQEPAITMGQILKAMTAWENIAKSGEYDPAWAYLNSMVAIYKSRKRITSKHIVQTFKQAYLNDGTDTFVLDNLLALQADRSDNTAMANACDDLRLFVAEYPVTLFLAVHPRKPPNDTKSNPDKPPTQADIRGAAEVGDMCHNLMIVWRDMKKKRQLEEMKINGMGKLERKLFYESTPCGFVSLEKQRLTGAMPKMNTWFDNKVNQFVTRPGAAKPMFDGSVPPWELEPSA